MGQTLVSVVIPTYQREEFLRKALLSVQQQSYENYEVWVVNDHPSSRQEVEKVVRDLKDKRFNVLHHRESRGGNAARNTGIERSKGEIIAFLDDDDEWKPQKLERHVHAHLEKEVAVVYSDADVVWENGFMVARTQTCPLPEEPVREAMKVGDFCPATTSAVTVQRYGFVQQGNFDGQLVSFQDWDMWYRLARSCKFHRIAEPLVIFRQHLEPRTSKDVKRRMAGLKQITRKWKSEVEVDRLTKKYGRTAHHYHIRDLMLNGDRMSAFRATRNLMKLVDTPTDIWPFLRTIIMVALGPRGYVVLHNCRVSLFRHLVNQTVTRRKN
jgi:glycosyltransferase involved in cell wall biosynthesis